MCDRLDPQAVGTAPFQLQNRNRNHRLQRRPASLTGLVELGCGPWALTPPALLGQQGQGSVLPALGSNTAQPRWCQPHPHLGVTTSECLWMLSGRGLHPSRLEAGTSPQRVPHPHNQASLPHPTSQMWVPSQGWHPVFHLQVGMSQPGSKVPSPPGAQSTRSPLGTGGGSPSQAPLPLVSSKVTLGGAGPKHPRLSPGSGREPPGATGELHPAARQGPQPGAQRPAPPTTLLGKVAPGSLLAVTQPIPSPWQDRGPQRQLSPQS